MKTPFRLLDWKQVKKTGRGYSHREMTVVELMSELFDTQGIQNFLNIGFHDYQIRRKRWWIDICRANEIDWTILEVFEPNCNHFLNVAPLKDHHRIIQGNILGIDKIFQQNFDVVFHWHGPEHLHKNDYIKALPKIEAIAKKMLILGCPNGFEEQGLAYGNPHERHISFWTEEDFKELGFETILIQDKAPGHITAYKKF